MRCYIRTDDGCMRVLYKDGRAYGPSDDPCKAIVFQANSEIVRDCIVIGDYRELTHIEEVLYINQINPIRNWIKENVKE